VTVSIAAIDRPEDRSPTTNLAEQSKTYDLALTRNQESRRNKECSDSLDIPSEGTLTATERETSNVGGREALSSDLGKSIGLLNYERRIMEESSYEKLLFPILQETFPKRYLLEEGWSLKVKSSGKLKLNHRQVRKTAE
jgi:hypothetical protein